MIYVIGGGAAGMFAAIQAGYAGAKVLLLEPNDRLGKKLYITGKGRCNLTNDCPWQEVLKNVPRNPRFLYSALSGFTPATAALVESAIKSCSVSIAGVTHVGNDFYSWLQSIGALGKDGRGNARSGSWWPGAYQN